MSEVYQTAPAPKIDTPLSSPPRSPMKIVWHRLMSSWFTIIALALVVMITFFAFVGPFVPGAWRYDEEDDSAQIYEAPSASHWLGTDGNRRDILSRLMLGGRISLLVGFVASAISVLVGIVYGAISGYVGGWVDKAMMRFVDVLYSIPLMLFVIIVMVIVGGLDDLASAREREYQAAVDQYTLAGETLGNPEAEASFSAEGLTELRTVAASPAPHMSFIKRVLKWIFSRSGGLTSVFLALAFFYWLTMARIVRGQVLALRRTEYVLAARTLGAGPMRIIFRHLIPNTLGPVIVTLTLNIPQAIFTEAYLSYLGLGVPAPMASWGTLANDGLASMGRNPTLLIAASVAISVTMLAFNYLGDALRDATDPRLHRD